MNMISQFLPQTQKQVLKTTLARSQYFISAQNKSRSRSFKKQFLGFVFFGNKMHKLSLHLHICESLQHLKGAFTFKFLIFQMFPKTGFCFRKIFVDLSFQIFFVNVAYFSFIGLEENALFRRKLAQFLLHVGHKHCSIQHSLQLGGLRIQKPTREGTAQRQVL